MGAGVGAAIAAVEVVVAHRAGEPNRAVAVAVGPEEGAAVLRVVEAVPSPVDDRVALEEAPPFVPGGAPAVGVGARPVREADDAADQRRG